MPTKLTFFYGEDMYDHSNRIRSYHEELLHDPASAPQVIESITKQLLDLFKKKRVAWIHGHRVDFDAKGSSFTHLFSHYHPLKERIVLNGEAKNVVPQAMTKALKELNIWGGVPPVVAAVNPVFPDVWIDPHAQQNQEAAL